MAEITNEKVFDAEKKFVDFAGLDYFWGKAKEHIDSADDALDGRLSAAESDIDALQGVVGDDNSGLVKDVKSIQDELDSLSGGAGSIATQIENAIATLDVEDTAVDGQYVSSVSEVDGKISVTRADLPDFTDAIATAEQNAKDHADAAAAVNKGLIDGLSGRISGLEALKHASDVTYVDKTIYLLDADGNKLGEGFDASEFVVDGMLDSVKFEEVDGVKTNNLEFVFNTDAGKEKLVVDFSKYVDVYKADNTSLSLDSTTNTFSVKNVDASKTTVGSDIQIAGGPLANDIAEANEEWPTDWVKDGVKIIPQGKSLEEILTALFLKVVNGTVTWPTVAKINETWKPSINQPSATLKQGSSTLSSTSVVEVGSTVVVSAASAGSVSAGTRTATCTCTQGYFTTNAVDENGKPTGTWNSGNYVLTASTTGSKKTAITGEASLAYKWNTNATDITLNSTELEIVEGTNTLNVAQSGQTATAEAFDSATVWASTNTKSLLSNTSATLTDTKPSDKALSSNKDFTCKGRYKYFLGYSTNTSYDQFDSAAIRKLTTKSDWITVDGTTTIVGDSAIKSSGVSIVIACPKKYKLATINNGVGANILDNFTTKGSQGEVSVATGGINTIYNVYVYPITNGAEVEFKNVTLTKA